MIVAGDQISKRGETLVNALNHHFVGKGIADMLKFDIYQSFSPHKTYQLSRWAEEDRSCFLFNYERSKRPTSSYTADKTASGNGSMNNRNVVSKLGLEGAIEVLRSTSANEAVLVGQLGKDTNIVASFKLNT